MVIFLAVMDRSVPRSCFLIFRRETGRNAQDEIVKTGKFKPSAIESEIHPSHKLAFVLRVFRDCIEPAAAGHVHNTRPR